MKLKDWLRERKKRREARRLKKIELKHGAEAEESGAIERKMGLDAPELQPLGADTEGIEKPESRFTEEYREFLKKKDAAEAEGGITREEK